MAKDKVIFVVFLIFVIILNLFSTMVYAEWVPVTTENLNESFQKFITSEENDKHYQITVEDNQIKIKSDDGDFLLNYDLTDKPTFTYEVEVKQGMSYDEFNTKTNELIVPMLGYVATADIQGIEFEDSVAYFTLVYMGAALSNLSSSNKYLIVDDLSSSSGDVTVSGNDNVIYTSQFGDHVMEYVNDMYNKETKFGDSDSLNTFEISIGKKDETSTSCKLEISLAVNKDADFSMMKGYAEKLSNESNNKEDNNTESPSQDNATPETTTPDGNLENTTNNEATLTPDNTSLNANNEAAVPSNNVSQNEVANLAVMPKTGKEGTFLFNVAYIFISISIVGIVILIATKKNNKK